MIASKRLNPNIYQLLFFTLSPLWVLLLVTSLHETFENRSLYDLGTGIVESAFAGLMINFITQGHVVAVFFKALGDTRVRHATWKKTLLGTLLILSITTLSRLGFIVGLIAMNFWIHYHYLRQHFGVLRMVSPRERLLSALERNLDNVFCFSIYLVPILYFLPNDHFSPTYISKIFLMGGLVAYITPVMFALEMTVKFVQWSYFIWVAFWGVYFVYLFLDARRRNLAYDHLLFMLCLMISNVMGSILLPPSEAIINVVLLHSVQYYYIVARDFSKGQSSWKYWAYIVAPVAAGLGFGVLFSAYEPVHYLREGGSVFMFFGGLAIAANLAHYYLDAYVWKRIPDKAA